MTLPEYVQKKGLFLARQSSVGEWAGPCPLCGGSDRFRVFETGGRKEADVAGRFFCRQCGIKGDYLSWLIDIEGQDKKLVLSAHKKTESFGKGITFRFFPVDPKNHSEEKQAVTPSPLWSDQAERFLSSAMQEMKNPNAAAFFREGRGLTGATCRALGLGWQSADFFTASELWGLPEGKKVVVPAGAVLPIHRAGRVVAVLVRRSKPFTPHGTEKPLWFHEVRGGARGVPFLCGSIGAPLVVCESVLCAASVYQVSNGEIAALASLGATKKGFDSEAVEFLKSAPLVLVVADDDEPGQALFELVRDVRPDAEAYTVPRAESGEPFTKENGKPVKDINDLLQFWRTDKKVFGWLAHGFILAEQKKEARGSAAKVATIVATGETKKEQVAGWSQVAPAKKDGAEVNTIINAVDPKKEKVAGMVAGGHDKKARAAETRPDEVAGAVAPRHTKKDGAEVAGQVATGNPKKSETGQRAAVSSFVQSKDSEAELSEVEAFRLFSPAKPPLIAQDMPDYPAFCVGYPHGCIHCPYYIHTQTGLFCSMWETIYPGAVKWYPMQDEPADF